MGRKKNTQSDSVESKKLVDKPRKQQKSIEELEAYKKYQKHLKSDYFKQVKEAVYQRDNNHCMCCGRSRDEGVILSVHHNDYSHLGSELKHLDDVILVCRTCHMMIHRNRANWQRFKLKELKNKT